jgi:hypothetical protein
MFDQFWQQYPQGSILSDLVQIHEDLYVVKVTLASAGQPLVATLAAADRLETAEAMARAQAMQILGCGESLAIPVGQPEPISQPEPSVVVAAVSPETLAEPLTVHEPEDLLVVPEPFDDAPDSLAGNGAGPVQPEMVMEPQVSPTPQVSEEAVMMAPAKTRSKKATALPMETTPEVATTADTAPLSVTDIIPLINMELKRLNWSREQGRDYMVSLYNKRASSLLSDEELFGLLQHLRDEPGEG